MAFKTYRIDKDGKYYFYTWNNKGDFNFNFWLEDDGRFILKDDGTYYTYYNDDGTPNLLKEKEASDLLEIENLDKVRTKAMLDGANYNGIVIFLTKKDGDGLVQVKNGFELGLTDTVIHFENGTKLPMNILDFPDFALWFVNERNKFFVGA